MTVRCCRAAMLILFVVLSSGCNVSLQSSQYAFVRNLLKPGPPIAEENWRVTWGKRDYLVYAVNHDGGIYFANESGLLVSFEGSQITSLSLPGTRFKKTARITKVVMDDGAISLQFQNENGLNVGSHLCSAWQLFTPQDKSKGWKQQCEDGSKMYTNEIRTNEQNQVIALKQVIVPGVAAIVISQRG